MVECIVTLKGASEKEECSSQKIYFLGLGEGAEKGNKKGLSEKLSLQELEGKFMLGWCW